jgi:hypothetical protein
MENESIWTFGLSRQKYAAVPSFIPRSAFPADSAGIQEDRQTIEIYRAVLRRLCGSQRVARGKFVKPLFFILYSEADSLADPDSRSDGSPALSETVRRGITRGVGDLLLRIVWVEDIYGVGRDPDGEYIPCGGAVVRFHNIRHDKTDFALIDGSIHRWGMSALGFEYVVEKKSGFWMVRSSYQKWIG